MSTFADLLKYLKIYRRYLGRRMYLVFVLATATAATSAFGITLLLPLLKASQTGSDPGEMGTAEQMLYDMLTWMGVADSMGGILAFIAIVFVGKGLLSLTNGTYKNYLQAQLHREVKSKLFDAYTGMEFRHYISKSTGHFINVINKQVRRFYSSFNHFVSFFTQVFTTIAYFTSALALAWKFSLLAAGIGGVILYLFKHLNSYVRTLSRKASKEASTLNNLLVQVLESLKYIVSTNRTKHLRSRAMDSIWQLTGYSMRQGISNSFTSSIKEPISVLLITGIIALQVVVLQEPVAPIFVALVLFHRGMQAIISLQTGWQKMMNKIGGVEMVHEELQTILSYQEDRKGKTLGPLSERVTFDNVCFAYDEEDGDVLRNINITVPVNHTVALVGESGAGKSTLVDMMSLLLLPRRGEIRIDGVRHNDVDLNSWRDQIGYVSQETVVFDDTVANNISLWGGKIDQAPALREQVIHAAEQAHADHFIRDLPDGYQTMVGDRGVRLSGGQRQRLSIARELFKQPNLLLLDEATSDLDTASEQHIQDSIDALKGEMTVVIIAHRLSTVKSVDWIYVLDEGRVIEEGTYHELQSRKDGRFREMVEMQSL